MDIDLLATECDDVDGELRRKLCERLSSGQLDLPVLPEVAVQLLSVVNDPDYNASRLAKLIHRDQSIASHLLRISNSAMYSPAPANPGERSKAKLGESNLAPDSACLVVQFVNKPPGIVEPPPRALGGLGAGASTVGLTMTPIPNGPDP